ncbi:MAG: dihydroorotase [Halobacteriales archaeon]|nr:dihydroorotase [Halobacteriales archaeon]
MDLVLAGRAWVRGQALPCEVGVEEGRIARIAKSLTDAERAGAQVVRFRGLLLPGAVDAHVHLREPGFPQKETIRTGTLAALHGGVTTVLDMPNTQPPVTDRLAFRDKAERFAQDARVDWGLHALVDPDLRAFALGTEPVGYKLYLGPSTHVGGFPMDRLADALSGASLSGRPIVVHAEHPSVLREGRDHGNARPVQAEWGAIAALAERAPERITLLVAHCTTARGLKQAKEAGFAAEVSPHHVLLDDGALRDQGARAKVNPPLRGPKERAALWAAFAKGQATTLGSDHAPHTLEEKAAGVEKAPSGMPGVETMLPLMLAKVKARALPLGVLVRAACERPAELFGLPKGRIAPGYDADLVLVETSKVERIRAARLHSLCGWTCFEDWPAVFPQRVWLRGQEALADGEARDVRGQPARRTGKPS